MKDNDIKVYNFIDFLEQIDFYSIFGVLAPGIISYVSNNPKFKKNKTNKPSLDKPRIIRKELGRIIIDFLEVVKDNIEEVNPKIIINNFNNLVIDYSSFEKDIKKTEKLVTGTYCPETNRIELSKDNYMLTIFHELFHAASSYIDYTNESVYTGFEYIHNGEILAEGINEGYTQYLTEKYFGDREIFRTYIYEKRIAEILEDIIGVKRMQWCYFNASLSSLIHELEKYSSYEEIIEFIKSLDYICYMIHKEKVSKEIQEEIQSKFTYISEFLIKVITKQNLIGTSKEEFRMSIDVVAPILAKIPSHFKTNDADYEIINKDTISRCVEEVIVEKTLVKLKRQ